MQPKWVFNLEIGALFASLLVLRPSLASAQDGEETIHRKLQQLLPLVIEIEAEDRVQGAELRRQLDAIRNFLENGDEAGANEALGRLRTSVWMQNPHQDQPPLRSQVDEVRRLIDRLPPDSSCDLRRALDEATKPATGRRQSLPSILETAKRRAKGFWSSKCEPARGAKPGYVTISSHRPAEVIWTGCNLGWTPLERRQFPAGCVELDVRDGDRTRSVTLMVEPARHRRYEVDVDGAALETQRTATASSTPPSTPPTSNSRDVRTGREVAPASSRQPAK